MNTTPSCIYLTYPSSSGLWGIVNNAGWATFGEVEWVAVETHRRALEVNVLGVLAGVKTMLPLIRAARGRVVTITSGLGRMAVPTRCAVTHNTMRPGQTKKRLYYTLQCPGPRMWAPSTRWRVCWTASATR